MRFLLGLYKPVYHSVILFVFSFYVNSSLAGEAQCPDVWNRGYLNVLTVNLALFEIERRDERLENFAEFAETKALDGEPVDVILLQEGVAGDLVNTKRGSPGDLQKKLQEHGLIYELRTATETGVPGILTTRNAI